MDRLFEVIHETNELLVINKPAGLVCHPTKTDEYSSLIGRARLYLGKEVRPHMVNRLDRETSGVVIVAKNSETAGELGKLWESRAVEKEYQAIVHGDLSEEHGLIDAALGKDEGSRIAIKDCVRADGAAAQTEYWVLRRFENGATSASGRFTLLRVVPRTGRKHQIRIHLAHVGHSIVGDKMYGGDEDLYMALVEDRLTAEQKGRLMFDTHCLHACAVRFKWRDRDWEFEAEAESWFREFAGGGVL